MVWNDILFYGDSLTFGSRDEYGRCFPLEMIELFQKMGVYLVPIIEAFPGYTSSQLLKMAGEKSIKYRGIKEMVFQVGTNDTKIEYPIKKFAKNIEQTLNIFFDKQIYLLTIPIPNGFGSNSYQNYKLKLINDYNIELENISHNHKNINLIRLNDCSYVDGIHFDNNTNIKIALKVFNKIRENRSF